MSSLSPMVAPPLSGIHKIQTIIVSSPFISGPSMDLFEPDPEIAVVPDLSEASLIFLPGPVEILSSRDSSLYQSPTSPFTRQMAVG